MKNMLILFFGLTVGNAILAPIGLIGPGSNLPGIFSAGLAFASFLVLVILSQVDWKSRATFSESINEMRKVVPNGHPLCVKMDDIQTKIMKREELLDIAHDIGRLHENMLAAGYLLPTDKVKPEAHL